MATIALPATWYVDWGAQRLLLADDWCQQAQQGGPQLVSSVNDDGLTPVQVGGGCMQGDAGLCHHRSCAGGGTISDV